MCFASPKDISQHSQTLYSTEREVFQALHRIGDQLELVGEQNHPYLVLLTAIALDLPSCAFSTEILYHAVARGIIDPLKHLPYRLN